MRKELSPYLATLTLPPLQGFSSGETDFHLCQFLSNFLRYFVSNFLLSYPYSIFVIYLPGNSILLNSFALWFNPLFCSQFTSSCLFISVLILPSKSFTNFFAFFKFFSLSHMPPFAVNPFHYTRYFSTPLIFLLFKILSTSHFSTPSTSTGFPSSLFCSFTCSLYHTTQLTLTTRWILIELSSCSFTTFNNTTSSTSYGPIYLFTNLHTSLSLNTKSFILSITLSPFFYSSVFFLFWSAYLFISSCIFFNAVPTSFCTLFNFSMNSIAFFIFSFLLMFLPILNSLP